MSLFWGLIIVVAVGLATVFAVYVGDAILNMQADVAEIRLMLLKTAVLPPSSSSPSISSSDPSSVS